MSDVLRVTVWNEGVHEKTNKEVAGIYPDGIHEAIAAYLRQRPGLEVRTAVLDQPEHGLTEDVLAETDVLTWWGHAAHGQVDDAVVERVHARVLDGMGLIVLHSGHFSKIFKKLMGTSCDLKWGAICEKQRLWVVEPGHPIAEGLDEYFELEQEEMYGERFDIPRPDELILVSWFAGGQIFRSGCCFYRGRGKIFYFQPGHETVPAYYDKSVLRVIENGIRWAAPAAGPKPVFGRSEPIE